MKLWLDLLIIAIWHVEQQVQSIHIFYLSPKLKDKNIYIIVPFFVFFTVINMTLL